MKPTTRKTFNVT